ncbi:MAG: hypothetical protein H7334_12640, partial [Ferruginibacter sp.]|nr:hypothetical protein [Ferruginibacter sp.]
MGTARFELRTDKPNKTGACPLRLVYSIQGERRYLPQNKTFFKINWNDKLQCVIYCDKKQAKKLLPGVDFELLLSAKEVEEINNQLTSLR